LAAPVRSEQDPMLPDKHRSEGIEGLLAQHAGCAAMVVHDSWKRAGSLWLEQDAMKHQAAAWKGHDLRGRRGDTRQHGGACDEQDRSGSHSTTVEEWTAEVHDHARQRRDSVTALR